MIDPEYDSNAERPYECFTCGMVLGARNNSDSCPNCGGEMRNHLITVE
ncbi:MAG: rubrerythrin-like domain-containing protein [Halobacteriota archaeon]